MFRFYSYRFSRACRPTWGTGGRRGAGSDGVLRGLFGTAAERHGMDFQHIAGAAFRALTARKDGPSLYEVCDPLLLKYDGGDPHLGQFYRTALGNPALRPLLRRAGLAELRDGAALRALRDALAPGPRRRGAGLGRDRPAGGGAAGYDRTGAPCPPARAGAGARARYGRDRTGDPHRRRASAALVRPQRLHPDLCRLQPDRRRRSARPRTGDGADRSQLPRLQELDAAVQPGADLHRPLARPRR